MAEAALFSVASKLLSTIASPAFEKAYEKGQSIWNAKDDLKKLKGSIQTIKVGLLDAEKKQESSDLVKEWIKRVREVLYDAEDLFDEVATDDMLKKRLNESQGNNKPSLIKKVRVSCFKYNPIVSRNSIAKRVKDIRQRLHEISIDMRGFHFVGCDEEKVPTGLRGRQDPGCFVDAKEVIGRDEDKKAILEVLFNKSNSTKPDAPVVISVVGIGGMGKTTLAQLIYNDEGVKIGFEKRWFACISDTCDDKEVIGKIFQSIFGEEYSSLNVSQLQTKIRESIEGKNFLLFLDDVWDEDRARWQNRMSLLGGGAKGSKIIVTTRSPLVAKVVGSLKTHNLDGLSDAESWSLFKRIAFTPKQENDPRWTNLGREIMKKCRNVPLAIKSIGSLLFEKNTIHEWEYFRDEKLSKLKDQGGNVIMNTLKLSYEHIPSSLKHCFAYCSLFPKIFVFDVDKLIYLWIAQGYIKQNHEMENIEQAGQSYFMYLLRRGFFQEVVEDGGGKISTCKMHDLIHDLAIYVAGEESTTLTSTPSNASSCTRHLSVGRAETDDSHAILETLHNVKQLRSCLWLNGDSIYNPTSLDQLFANFKLLRILSLQKLRTNNVSRAIGELKHLRYLDLSKNRFRRLPDSITNLVNLLALDMSLSTKLSALPEDFRKLINLRYLNIDGCWELKHMPPKMGDMSCLQYLSHFKVGRGKSEEGEVKKSGLDALARLQHQLKGVLNICFDRDIMEEEEEEKWAGDECSWQLPISPQKLEIWYYLGLRIPDWGNNGKTNNLASLGLIMCRKVKCLPPLRFLPNLRILKLEVLEEIEYVEEDEENKDRHRCTAIGGSIHDNVSSIFFPCLEVLRLAVLPKLKGWRRKVAVEATSSLTPRPQTQFPLLDQLRIQDCPELELKSFPLCPNLQVLELDRVDENEVMQQHFNSTICCSSFVTLPSHACTSPPGIKHMSIERCKWLEGFQDVALASLQHLKIHSCCSLKSLHLASPRLQQIFIESCDELMNFELLVEAPTTSLRVLEIKSCKQLKNLRVAAHLNALKRLTIADCPELNLWESPDMRRCHLDWDSLTNLRELVLDPLTPLEKLPHCLQQRHALGKLYINYSGSRLQGIVQLAIPSRKRLILSSYTIGWSFTKIRR